ncbi:MAG TPA: glutamate--tRNA ligase [Alphaproteobacteria bacterium]|nr:glutamate--tRNA ligase [Alphaproteobacteria bacterium]
MTVAVRFAPSPTGWLHVGNIRAALVNWLFARQHGGSFLLRLDDTDRERSRPEYAEGVQRDLAWLGLPWDGMARQSDRLDRYAAAVERLKASGHLYPCYETPEELELRRKSQLAAGKPPLYDRAALRLSEADRARLEAEGRAPHWRFRLDHRPIQWQDRIRGAVQFHGKDISDPVVVRADGQVLYNFASVVDDIEFGITDIIRGEDHVTNSASQVQMFEALGAAVPRLGHYALMADASGAGFSKREGSLSIATLREEGIEPMAILSLLAKLGTSDAIEPRIDIRELVDEFDIGHFGRATAKFDIEELRRLNARVLHQMPHHRVADRLAQYGDIPPAFWTAVKPNLERFADIADWVRVAHGPVEPVRGDPAFLAQAAETLPPEPWDETTWSAWTAALKAASGKSGKALFLPLRQALTGMDHGPELRVLLPLIGRERALARLRG